MDGECLIASSGNCGGGRDPQSLLHVVEFLSPIVLARPTLNTHWNLYFFKSPLQVGPQLICWSWGQECTEKGEFLLSFKTVSIVSSEDKKMREKMEGGDKGTSARYVGSSNSFRLAAILVDAALSAVLFQSYCVFFFNYGFLYYGIYLFTYGF